MLGRELLLLLLLLGVQGRHRRRHLLHLLVLVVLLVKSQGTQVVRQPVQGRLSCAGRKGAAFGVGAAPAGGRGGRRGGHDGGGV